MNLKKNLGGLPPPEPPCRVVVVTDESEGRDAGAPPELTPTLTNFLVKAAIAAGVPRARVGVALRPRE